MSPTSKPLAGWRVLVPRGGKWGDNVAASLRAVGGIPVIAPLINFASTENESALAEAFSRLAAGHYDWLVVTSATTVDVFVSQGVTIAAETRVAAVGETTAAALTLAGYRVDFVPETDNSARGLIKEWPDAGSGRVLIPHSDMAEPLIEAALAERDLDVEYVAAYRTVGVSVAENVAADVASGRVRAILVSSGSVARQIAEQLAPLPAETVVACIGPRTAFDAREAGLSVDVIAEERSEQALVEALVEHVRQL
jgi:uroporphyrinogen-III synthase